MASDSPLNQCYTLQARDSFSRSPAALSAQNSGNGSNQAAKDAASESSDASFASVLEAWPKEPEALGQVTALTVLSSIADSVLVLLPAIFLALGIAILAVSGKPTIESRLGQQIETAVRLGPTVFPLLFAAVVARSLKILGRYVCQRGTKLETVELLLGSRSVWGTIESHLSLHRCTIVSAQLLLLWSLSPLGGQASLRSLKREERITRNTTTLRYLYTGPYAPYLRQRQYKGMQSAAPIVSLLRAPERMKGAPLDNWSNVRVPRLESLPRYSQSSSEWLTIPPITAAEQLSSLLGVPLIGLPPVHLQLAVDFTIQTSYMSLSCAAWETYRENDERLAAYKSVWRGWDPFRDSGNTTFFLDGDMPPSSWANVSAVAQDRRTRHLFFGSARLTAPNETEFTVSATKCAVTATHVEVAITCRAGNECRPHKMRRSLVDTRPESSVPLEDAERMRWMTFDVPFMYGNAGTASTMQEVFLRHGAAPLPMPRARQYVDMSQVPPATFARRLLLLVNTAYQLSLVTQTPVFYNDNPPDLARYGFDFGRLPANGSVAQSVVDASCLLLCTRSTSATVASAEQVFAYSRVWLTLLLGSASALLVMGLACTVVGWRTYVPDMLGYVASMTYNNDYIPLPQRGGVLNAMHRARILRDLPVLVGDVSVGSEVGRVAFTTDTSVPRLEKGRQYI